MRKDRRASGASATVRAVLNGWFGNDTATPRAACAGRISKTRFPAKAGDDVARKAFVACGCGGLIAVREVVGPHNRAAADVHLPKGNHQVATAAGHLSEYCPTITMEELPHGDRWIMGYRAWLRGCCGRSAPVSAYDLEGVRSSRS